MPFRHFKARVVGRAVAPIAYWETYDAEKIRRALRARHISPLPAMRNTENGSGLGRWRWVIERTFAWLNQVRRLRLRYEKDQICTRRFCRSRAL
jgi:transposase